MMAAFRMTQPLAMTKKNKGVTNDITLNYIYNKKKNSQMNGKNDGMNKNPPQAGKTYRKIV